MIKEFSAMLKSLSPIFNAIEQRINTRINHFLLFVKVHFTGVAVIVFFIIGALIIWINAYIKRYFYSDYWNWKKRGRNRIVWYGIVLIFIKLLFLL